MSNTKCNLDWLEHIGQGIGWVLFAIAIVIMYKGCNDKPLPFLDPATQSSNHTPPL